MSPDQAAAVAPAPRSMSRLLDVLAVPWLDRTIAIVACVPFVALSYYRFRTFSLGVPLISITIGTLLLILTMIVRRPPRGHPLVPSLVSDSFPRNVV